MSQLPLVPCGFCSCSETAATTPCQTDKRICFFSRCCKPTSFLCLKHFIWHGNTETTTEKLPTLLQLYLSRQQKNSLLAIMMYECIAKRTKYIFIRLSVITQLEKWTLYWATSTIMHNYLFKLYFNIIPSHSTFRITCFKNISSSTCILHSPPILTSWGGHKL